MTTIRSILAGTLILGVVSCISEKNDSPVYLEPVAVTVTSFGSSGVKESFQYTGKVVSDHQTMLSTKLLGHVEEVLVQEGQPIKKGQLLVKVKSQDVNAKLAAARAGRKEAVAAQTNAQKNFTRVTNLFEKGSATQRELDDITTQRNAADARVEGIDQNIAELTELLTYANLKSPIDGFVARKQVNPGDLASPGQPLLLLESLSELKIDLMIPEFEIGLFEVGDAVSVAFQTLPNALNATVSAVVPSTANGAQFKVSVVLQDTTQQVKPGMTGNVTIYKKSTEKLILKEEYVHRKGQLQGVYTVNQQGQAMLRWLRLGELHADGYEVLSGLDQGEIIITSAAARLVNGQPVDIKQ